MGKRSTSCLINAVSSRGALYIGTPRSSRHVLRNVNKKAVDPAAWPRPPSLLPLEAAAERRSAGAPERVVFYEHLLLHGVMSARSDPR